MTFDSQTIYIVCLTTAFTICLLYIAIKQYLKTSTESKINDIEWLEPPKYNATLPNGIKIAYRQDGKGKDLLLIHGIGANTFCWRLIYPQLCKKYKVTCIDLPGFGYSIKSKELNCGLDEQMTSVNLFVDTIKLNKPILIGSSMGGTIALWMSMNHPKKYTKVIALAPAAGVRLIPVLFRKIKSVSYYLNWGLNQKTMILILKHIFNNKKLVTNYTVKGYLQPYLNNKTDSIHGFVSAKDLILDSRLPHAFSNLSIKPLIIASRKDKMVNKKSIQALLKALPKYDFHLHDTAGHHIMEEVPNWVLEKVHDYLNVT